MQFIPKRNKKEKDLEGLRREIDILRRLNHENIILLLDAFETRKEFVMVTEFAQVRCNYYWLIMLSLSALTLLDFDKTKQKIIQGEVFEILEDDGKLPEDQVRSIARQVVKALHYLHMHRVIHRYEC